MTSSDEERNTPLEDARAALERHDFAVDEAERIVGSRIADDPVVIALRALIADYERQAAHLKFVNDERQIVDWLGLADHADRVADERDDPLIAELSDALRTAAAGFRRQGPITDARPYSEATDIEYGAWETDDIEEHALDMLAVVAHRRAALEAAREVD